MGTAGFGAIAVSFGPARAGYGLFLPDFRVEFGLTIQQAGFVASGLQAGYLVALTAVGLLVARAGPGPMVLLGMLAAGLGMILVAVLAAAPGSLTACGVSAALYGVGVMAMSSLLALWSSLVFPERPATGFSATLFLFGLGCVAGPAAPGAYGGEFGLDTAFVISAAVSILTAACALLPVTPRPER